MRPLDFARFAPPSRCPAWARRSRSTSHGPLVRRHGADVPAVHRGPLRDDRRQHRPHLRARRHRRRHGAGRVGRAGCRAAFGEARLVRMGCLVQAVAFALLGFRPRSGRFAQLGALRVGRPHRARQRPTHAVAAGLRLAARGADTQGLTLGIAAVGLGPGARCSARSAGGALYAALEPRAPYYWARSAWSPPACSPRACLAVARLR